ncbi:histidinol dehydrogenase [Hathewaya proteolytica DSM 3090]|uniref:Histidinol dehydrogenase n=1 Tax=Hathewaya proteolytica DSM 3090 TaxID=1121331 RepID=A0A1M6RGY3_9CLOT|nr:histidinol dehydrogenase [Hathewaya proteolytica DSM 3090]
MRLSEINIEDKKVLKKYLDSRREDINSDILKNVVDILQEVKLRGDAALRQYTAKFDGVELGSFEISKTELEQCFNKVDPFFVESMKQAKENIEFYHKAQIQNGYTLYKEYGVYLGQRVIPLDSVGVYVPGGRAQYPSSVLMNVIPAKLAGVKNIVMITPPSKGGGIDPYIGVAACMAGVDKIYTLGGAQGIAALAYGTETIEKVDKIIGPGNIYVAAAKKLVYGTVDIDMIAGPSEILVIADEGADPSYVAADLLSQAEHDTMASSILLTTSKEVAEKTNYELEKQLSLLPKKDIAEDSVKNFGKFVLCKSIEQCVELSNEIAPEHLELMIKNPMEYLASVRHAGSVFLGYYTCESIGDYFGGTNHVLPTGGTARFCSALSVDSFIKKSSYLYYSREAVEKYGDNIMEIAMKENLQGHANAVKVRLGK